MDFPFKVLITGIDGFSGYYMDRYLTDKGYMVYGTTLNNTSSEYHFKCDISKYDEVYDVISKVKPDFVIHFAAISFVGHNNISDFYSVNVIGTENILKALYLQNIKCKKIIISSSATVYGKQDSFVLDESMCPAPVNHYGYSKLSMEHLVYTYFDIFDIVIARPFNYTGVGQDINFLIPKIVKHYKNNNNIIKLGNLNIAREFNDVEYVMDIYYKLLISDVKSEVVNISSQKPIKLMHIIELMDKIAGYDMHIEVDQHLVRSNEIESLCGSVEKLTSLIGPLNTSSIEALLWKMYEA